MNNLSVRIPKDKLEDYIINLNSQGFFVVRSEEDKIDKNMMILFLEKIMNIDVDKAIKIKKIPIKLEDVKR